MGEDLESEEADRKNVLTAFRGKRVLVTGGGGYFGHKLGNELKRQGADVVLFDISWPFDEMAYSDVECIQVCVNPSKSPILTDLSILCLK